MDLFRLTLYQPLGVNRNTTDVGSISVMDINPKVTRLVSSTSIAGGFNACQVGLNADHLPMDNNGFLPRPVEYKRFAHCELKFGEFSMHEGRVLTRDRPGGEVWGFGSVGYGITGLLDNPYFSIDESDVATGVLIREVLTSKAPLINVGSIIDNGVLHSRALFNKKKPAQILDQLCKEGGTDDNLWDYYVWNGRKLYFVPRVPPQQVHYQVDWDYRTVDWKEDDTNAFGALSVGYQSGGAALAGPFQVPDLLQATGVYREELIEGGEMDAAGATQFAKSWLQDNVRPKISCVITRTGMAGLERPGGVPNDPWRVRAGQWVQVGKPFDEGGEPPLIIIHTEMDYNQGTLRATCQSFPFYLLLMNEPARIARYVMRGLNPNTGGAA